ncbi:hypothetical protein Tco_0279449, partial [Tanacetum coccineum]
IARIVKNSRACSFAFRVSHPQLHFGNPVPLSKHPEDDV